MNFANFQISFSTETIDRKELEKYDNNIYAIINIIGKRSTQINSAIKEELDKKLEEFYLYNDSLYDNLENKEQITIAKFYETLPKPTAIAIQEFIDGNLIFR
jgi:flagellin-specific chaperone FliS